MENAQAKPAVSHEAPHGERPQYQQIDYIATKSIHVTNDAGDIRAILGVTDDDGGFVQLMDVHGHSRAEIAVHTEGIGLVLMSEEGTARASLSVRSEGPHITFSDEHGRPRIQLHVSKNGPMLILVDNAGKTHLAVEELGDGTPQVVAKTRGLRFSWPDIHPSDPTSKEAESEDYDPLHAKAL